MKLLWAAEAWQDSLSWQAEDQAGLRRINELIRDISGSPFRGTGKPGPLKGDLAGWWSPRITQEHRLVYRVAGSGGSQRIEIVQCRFHY